ncbi:hypothetical protein [Agromyces sp. SYSU T00266]|uniref:hypothetical protein n=1 Tax=Agromyces zhanjiangensis TaxID=3158562 RepID=UPI003397FA37
MNLRTKSAVFGAALAVACSLGVVPASAAVTFDPGSGTGFVGKGDVQNAFAWNNAQFQQRAASVSFQLITRWVWGATCVFDGGSETSTQFGYGNSDFIDSTVRGTGQASGFDLHGYFGGGGGGYVPTDGDECTSSGGATGTWTSIEYVGTTTTLEARYGGTSVSLPY